VAAGRTIVGSLVELSVEALDELVRDRLGSARA
jgi:hypothetical protein